MPLRQLGLCTASTPGRSTATAPVTTTMGAAPPSRSSATPRWASRSPPISTSAFGCPSLLPPPAASRIPATPAGVSLCTPARLTLLSPSGWSTRRGAVVDAAGGGGERAAGAAPAQLDELGGDRDRGFLGRPCAQVEADRRAEPGQLILGQADLAEPGQPVVVGAPAAHRPD